MRGEAFVRAPGPSAVSRRSENALITEIFWFELTACVAPRSRAAPFVCGAPKRLFSAPQTVDVRARAAKMCGGAQTRREGVLFVCHVFHSSMH